MVSGFIPVNFNAVTSDIDAKVRAMAIMKATTLNETESFLINSLQTNAHVWKPGAPRTKPHMRDSVKREQSGTNYRIVSVDVPYAQKENARKGEKPGFGTHNFGDKAYDATVQRFRPLIIQRINAILGTHGVGVLS